MIGNSKADTLKGGKGADVIRAISNSYVVANAGNDTVSVTGGYDSIDGSAGNDEIYITGSTGHNTVIGGAGNDYIQLSGGNNVVSYTTGNGNDTVYNFVESTDKIYLGSAKTKITKSDYSNGEFTFTIGKGKLILENIGTDTGVTVTDYSGVSTVYTDNMVATATTVSKDVSSKAAFIERNYIVNDTWFTSVDGSIAFDNVEIDNFIRESDNVAVVSGDNQILSQIKNNFDDDLLGINVKSGSRLVQNKNRRSDE